MDTNVTAMPRVLPDLQSFELEELARLRAENARLKEAAARQAKSRVKFKVSDKGAVQLLGIGSRFGITLYPTTWLAIFDMAGEIKDFIEAHRDELSWSKDKGE